MAKIKTDQERHPAKYFTHSDDAVHPRDRIILHDSIKIPREGQSFSLNGFAYLIKPGVEVDVPRPVRLMIDSLIETETTYDKDGREYKRDIPRFPYVLVKENVNNLGVVPVPDEGQPEGQQPDASP